MSDTEEIVIKRKNTKPDIARNKLKEKRERLKKEKDELIINEAKKRLENEMIEDLKKQEEKKQAEIDSKNTDPTFLMMKKMEEMMAKMMPQTPVTDLGKTITSNTITKKPKKVSEAPKTKPARKPKQNTILEESPSNIFVGNREEPAPLETQTYTPNLLAQYLTHRRNMAYA